MKGEKNLNTLLRTLKPKLNNGDFVFCVVNNLASVTIDHCIFIFREQEGYTIVIKKELADSLKLDYSFIAAWITLTVHSSLEAVGLTAAFATALFKGGIGCNVVAAFYHDHIFVDKKDSLKAMQILTQMK